MAVFWMIIRLKTIWMSFMVALYVFHVLHPDSSQQRMLSVEDLLKH